MAKQQYRIEYVGAPNLPSGGLNPSLARFGELSIGKPRIAFLTPEQAAAGSRIAGVRVDLVSEPSSVKAKTKGKTRSKKS